MDKKNKYFGIDLIKVVAIISVICVHFLLNTKFYQSPIIGTSLTVQLFWRQLFYVCVPMFLLTTGFLQWEKKFDKKFLKGFLQIVWIYIFISVFVIIVRIVGFEENKSLLEWIRSVFVFKGIRYGWYMEMYIGLALLIPFLNKIWQGFETKKEFHIFLIVLLLLTSIPNFWNSFNEGIPFLSVIEFPVFWVEMYPITYYFIGVYIRKYGISLSIFSSFIGFLFVTLLETVIIYLKVDQGVFQKSVGGYSSVLVVLQSVFLFLMLYQVEMPQRFMKKIILVPMASISALTLDIYLASAITDQWIYHHFFERYFTSQKEAILYAPLIVLSSFTLAYGIALGRKSIFTLLAKITK